MSLPFFSDIDLLGNTILNIKSPSSNKDLVDKEYVDISIMNLSSDLISNINNVETSLSTQISNIQTNVFNIENNIPNMIVNSIVDNLNTQSNVHSLSANQGYMLNTAISNLNTSVGLIQTSISNLYENRLTNIPTLIGSYYENERYQFVKSVNIDNASSGFVSIDIFEDIPEIDMTTNVEIIDISGTYTDNNIALGYKRKIGYSDTLSTESTTKDINIVLISNNRTVDLLLGNYWVQEGTVDITLNLIIVYRIIPEEV